MTPYTLTLHCRKAALFNKTVDGISLASVLKRPATTLERDTLYWHYPHYYQTTSPVSAIRCCNVSALYILIRGLTL
jgi:hypothetical protein